MDWNGPNPLRRCPLHMFPPTQPTHKHNQGTIRIPAGLQGERSVWPRRAESTTDQGLYHAAPCRARLCSLGQFSACPTVWPLGKVGECLSWSPREESLHWVWQSPSQKASSTWPLGQQGTWAVSGSNAHWGYSPLPQQLLVQPYPSWWQPNSRKQASARASRPGGFKATKSVSFL